MKKINITLFISLLIIILPSCYSDKGNYDYIDVRTLNISFTPDNYRESESTGQCIFKFKQPFQDTAIVRIDAQIKGGLEKNNSLEFFWTIRISATRVDTFRTSYIDVKLAPRKNTDVSYFLKITDKTTALDYYRTINVKTITPYVDSWFVLHGTENNMKLGTAERSEEDTWISMDSYFDRNQAHRFQNAQKLIYSLNGFFNRFSSEMVTVIAGDSLFAMHPFNFSVKSVYERMIPPSTGRPILTDGFSDLIGKTMLRNNKNKLYHSPGEGHYYPVLTYSGDEDYQANAVCIYNGFALIWDQTKKKFYYYPFWNNNFGWNTSERNDAGNEAKLESFSNNFFAEGEFNNKKLIKIIPDTWDDGGVVFFAFFADTDNNAVTSYHISIESRELGDLVNVKSSLPNLILSDNSSIAVSENFNNQFFYSNGNTLHRYDMTSKESFLIYQVSNSSASISDIIFKRLTASQFPDLAHYTRNMGLVVNYPDNKGEIHDILLQNTSEVKAVHVLGGFEHINSAIFSETAIVR